MEKQRLSLSGDENENLRPEYLYALPGNASIQIENCLIMDDKELKQYLKAYGKEEYHEPEKAL